MNLGPLPSFGTELDTCRPYFTLTTMTTFLLICWKHTRSVIPCSGHDNGRGGHCAPHFSASMAARRGYRNFSFELLIAETQTRQTAHLTFPSRSSVLLEEGRTTSTGRVPPTSGSHGENDGGEQCCRVVWDGSALPAWSCICTSNRSPGGRVKIAPDCSPRRHANDRITCSCITALTSSYCFVEEHNHLFEAERQAHATMSCSL
jgi:hypothetical protein